MTNTRRNGRDENGRFAKGNAGGPGRPRRRVEEDYLRSLADAVSLDRWGKIVERAVTDAEQGDWRAREWLAKHVLGPDPKVETASSWSGKRLFRLAVEEAGGRKTDDKIQQTLTQERLDHVHSPSLADLLGKAPTGAR